MLWQQANIPNNNKQHLGYEVNQEGMLIYRGRMYVPNQKDIKQLILDKYHKIPCVGHPRYQKLITTLRKEYFWSGMKKKWLNIWLVVWIVSK